jgi:hypothetical protein
MRDIPRKGERYRHASRRGDWTVQSAGAKFVTLKSSLPFLPNERFPTELFMRTDWRKV